MTTTTRTDERKAQALEQLRRLCPPGATIYTCNETVSRSNMSACIKVYAIDPDTGQLAWLSGYIDALGVFKRRRFSTPYGYSYSEGVMVHGCGLDRGFEIVYHLGRVLYPDGFPCTGPGSASPYVQSCPWNGHANGDRDYTPGHHHDGDSGYALRHAWI